MKDRRIRYSNRSWVWMVASWALSFVLCAGLAPTVWAQNQDLSDLAKLTGQVQNPSVCPSNPSIIAYERIERDVQEILLYNVEAQTVVRAGKSEESTGKMSLTLDEALDEIAQDFSRYEGQLAWRPLLDADGRQWFAYVGSDGDELDLYLSYMDTQGRLSRQAPIKLPFSGTERWPQWAPDGQSIVFISGSPAEGGRPAVSDIYWVPDIASFMNRGRGDGFNPVALTNDESLELYPAWSPDGRYIAYQMRGGAGANWQINAISPFDNLPTPVVLTTDLSRYHEYKPSWSPDGEHLSFYVSQDEVGRETDKLLQDIGVAAIFRDGSGRITGGQVLSSLSLRLALNVVPHRERGPFWNPDSTAQEIIYVKRAEGFPIYLADFELWTAESPEYDEEFSRTFPTINHRDPVVALMPRGVRAVFIAQEGNANKVLEIDIPIDGMNRTIEVRQEVSRQKARRRSMYFPGLGQFYRGDSGMGTLFLGAELASIGTLIYAITQRQSNRDTYDTIAGDNLAEGAIPPSESYIGSIRDGVGNCLSNTSVPCENARFNEWDDAAGKIKTFGIVAGVAAGVGLAVWYFNVREAGSGFPRTIRRPVSGVGSSFRISAAQPHMEYVQGRRHYGFRVMVNF